MRLGEDPRQLSEQVKKRQAFIESEEATKQALIPPFLQTLGHHISDPTETQPEYVAGFAKKRGGVMEEDQAKQQSTPATDGRVAKTWSLSLGNNKSCKKLLSPALATLLTLFLSLASGCKQCAEEPPKSTPSVNQPQDSLTHDSQAASAIPKQLPVLDERVFELAGQIDAGNRYISTVRVRAQQTSATRSCSGVIVHPQLVLTAGHCVCARRKPSSGEGEAATIIDSSACAASAIVTTVTYKPAGLERRGSDGQVQPHPDLKVVLGPHGEVLSSTADLAAIFLSEPLSESFRPVPLATSEVQLHEFVTIVGYGYDEIVDGYTGDRRFSKNRVTKLGAPTPERILIEQLERHPYKLDSGGPCLRESPSGSTLVGVSGRSLGEEAAFTSTFPYQGWVRAQLRRLDTPH